MKDIFQHLLLLLMEKRLLPESDFVLLENQHDVIFKNDNDRFSKKNGVISNDDSFRKLISKRITIGGEYHSSGNNIIFFLTTLLNKIVISTSSNGLSLAAKVEKEQDNNNNQDKVRPRNNVDKSTVLKDLVDFIRDFIKPLLLNSPRQQQQQQQTTYSSLLSEESPIDLNHHQLDITESHLRRMDEIIAQSISQNDSSSPNIFLLSTLRRTRRSTSYLSSSAEEEQKDNDDDDCENDVQFAYGCSLMMVLLWAASKLIQRRTLTSNSGFDFTKEKEEDDCCDVEEKSEQVDEKHTCSSILDKQKQHHELQPFELELVTCQVQKELMDDLISMQNNRIADVNLELWKDLFEELLDIFPKETIEFIFLKATNKSLGSQLFIQSMKIRDEVLNQCHLVERRQEEETTALVFRLSEILENIQNDEQLTRTVFDLVIEHVLTNPTSREHLDCVIRAKRSLFGTTEESRSHLVDLYYWEQLLRVMQIVYFNRQLDVPQDPLLDECARQELANMTAMCVSNMLDHAAISHANHPEKQPQIQQIVNLVRHSGLYVACRMKQHDPEIAWFFIHYIIERTCWYPMKQIRDRANICVMVAKLDLPRLRYRTRRAGGGSSCKNKEHDQQQPGILHKDLIRLVHEMLVGK